MAVCVSHKNGALYQARKCAKHDQRLSWNQQGLQGAQGPHGIQGARGLQGQAGILGAKGDPGTARGYGSVPSSCAPNDSPPTSCTLSASSNATVTHPFPRDLLHLGA
jgi:hypothetical protein